MFGRKKRKPKPGRINDVPIRNKLPMKKIKKPKTK